MVLSSDDINQFFNNIYNILHPQKTFLIDSRFLGIKELDDHSLTLKYLELKSTYKRTKKWSIMIPLAMLSTIGLSVFFFINYWTKRDEVFITQRSISSLEFSFFLLLISILIAVLLWHFFMRKIRGIRARYFFIEIIMRGRKLI